MTLSPIIYLPEKMDGDSYIDELVDDLALFIRDNPFKKISKLIRDYDIVQVLINDYNRIKHSSDKFLNQLEEYCDLNSMDEINYLTDYPNIFFGTDFDSQMTSFDLPLEIRFSDEYTKKGIHESILYAHDFLKAKRMGPIDDVFELFVTLATDMDESINARQKQCKILSDRIFDLYEETDSKNYQQLATDFNKKWIGLSVIIYDIGDIPLNRILSPDFADPKLISISPEMKKAYDEKIELHRKLNPCIYIHSGIKTVVDVYLSSLSEDEPFHVMVTDQGKSDQFSDVRMARSYKEIIDRSKIENPNIFICSDDDISDESENVCEKDNNRDYYSTRVIKPKAYFINKNNGGTSPNVLFAIPGIDYETIQGNIRKLTSFFRKNGKVD